MSTLDSRTILPIDGCAAEHAVKTGVVGLLRVTRSTRVMLLMFAMVVMSLLDLYITLLYLRSVGLAEENPFARLVMSHGSAELLAGWKLLTVLPAVLVLVLYRKRFSAELLGWVACVILLGVTLRWVDYAEQTDLLVGAMPALEDGIDHRWVTLGSE